MSSTKKNAAETPPPHRWIRWKAMPPVVAGAVFAVAYLFFFFDAHLKWFLERMASVRNGARVEISHLHTDFRRGTVEIRGVHVASPESPHTDMLVVDGITLHFLVNPLLRKKIVIPRAEVKGVAFQAPRSTSGELPESLQPPEGVQSLIRRIASGAYADLHREINDNPLKHLDYLSTGLDLALRIYQLRSRLHSLRKIEAIRADLPTLTKKWRERTTDLLGLRESDREALTAILKKERELTSAAPPRAKPGKALTQFLAHLEARREEYRSRLKTISLEADEVSASLVRLNPLIDEDVALVHYELGVPRLDASDLTPALFGTRILAYLDQMTYWVDLTRRRMPAGLRTTLWPSLEGGTSVHFAKASAFPALLIENVTLESSSTLGAPYGDLKGSLSGLTTHPSMEARPLVADLEGSFPGSEIEGLRAHVEIDHTGHSSADGDNSNEESFSLSVGSFPLKDWRFYQSGPLKLSIKQARAELSITGTFHPTDLDIRWRADLKDVEYTVHEPDQRLLEVLSSSLEPVRAFTYTGSLKGSAENVKLDGSSELGHRLASALRDGFRYELSALDDTIRSSISEQLEPKKNEIFAEIRIAQTHCAEALKRALDEVDRLEAEARGPAHGA